MNELDNLIAIDIGSGLTKHMFNDEMGYIVTAVGTSTKGTGFSLGAAVFEQINYNGKQYFTGRTCHANLTSKDIVSSTTKNWCKSSQQLILALSVIAKLYPQGYSGKIKLALGLPIALYNEELSNYKQLFVGHHVFTTRSAEYKIEIHKEDIQVIPQVLGMHFKNVMLNIDDTNFSSGKFGYIDPGTQTTGYAVVDRNMFIPKLSDGEHTGMFHLGQKVSRNIKSINGIELSNDEEVLEAFRVGHVIDRGNGKDEKILMDKVSGEAVSEVFGKLLDTIRETWKGGRNMKVYVSSGGGRYILDEVKKRFSHAELMYETKKPKGKKPNESSQAKVRDELENEHSIGIYDVVEGMYYFARDSILRKMNVAKNRAIVEGE